MRIYNNSPKGAKLFITANATTMALITTAKDGDIAQYIHPFTGDKKNFIWIGNEWVSMAGEIPNTAPTINFSPSLVLNLDQNSLGHSLLSGVTVSDTEDGSNILPTFTITNSNTGVVITESAMYQAVGVYDIVYRAEDSEGLVTLKSRVFEINALPDFVATAVTTGLPVTMTASCELDIDWGDGILVNYPESPTLSVTGTAVGTGVISIKGFNVTAFRFVTNEFTDIHIEENSKQVNATSMFDSLSKLTNFTVGADAFKNCTNFNRTWYNCNSLTNFPLIDTSNSTSFSYTWHSCSSLTNFPLIDTSNSTSFSYTWHSCSSLISFPLIDTSSSTDFSATWFNCISLTSFPLIDTSSSTNFSFAWYNCTSLTNFPLINTGSGINFSSAWRSCSTLTDFPLIDTSSATNLRQAWFSCSSLTSFPLIDTSSSTNFNSTWYNCTSLTSFPLIDTSSSTNFISAWNGCTSLVCLSGVNTELATNTTDMFFNTPLLVNPTPAEQLQIADTSSGGLNYINSNNCPP